MKKTLLGLFLIVSVSLFAQKQGELIFSANFKTIGEFRQGYKNILSENQEPAYVLSQRSRLIFDYKNPNFDLRFSIQDTRAWGETFIINSSKPLLLHEAWVKYKMNSALSVTIGRQELNYGDQRIISSRNWSMQGATHDLALLSYADYGFIIDLGLAYNANSTSMLEASP
ncbi:MAG: alginate export family protein [Bacteroidales bacterium]|nr:alginate export family protein [Bacteroidales bacterium]